MTKYTKDSSGYHISGKTYEMLEGSRAQVWHGTAYKTSGGLTKSSLFKNKTGRIVSAKKHKTAKKEMRLVKHGYGTKKGSFGFVKMGSKSSRKHKSKRRKMRGGNGEGDMGNMGNTGDMGDMGNMGNMGDMGNMGNTTPMDNSDRRTTLNELSRDTTGTQL